MARISGVPSYRKHSSGQAIVTLRDLSGRRKDFLLGTYGSEASRLEYTRVVNEWQANHRRIPGSVSSDITINELIMTFWHHVEQHYRHSDGTPTSEVENYRLSLRPLREMYGHSLAARFGPLALKAVRKTMIDAGLARGVINQRISRIRHMFKWATSEELVHPSTYHGLKAVEGLQAGRSAAKDPPRVLPVSTEHVEAVLPLVNRYVRGMIQVQQLTGMRPGEVCSMKRSEIDMSGAIWFYKPTHHKTAWRGRERIVGIGPKAQSILKTFFTADIHDFLFSPARMMEDRAIEMRAKRKSKVQPSQVCRKKKNPQRKPRGRYYRAAYAYAIHRACIKAEIPKWHPNQLRHAFATEVRRRFGLEAAQVGLGHSRADVTQVYAEADTDLAAHVAANIG